MNAEENPQDQIPSPAAYTLAAYQLGDRLTDENGKLIIGDDGNHCFTTKLELDRAKNGTVAVRMRFVVEMYATGPAVQVLEKELRGRNPQSVQGRIISSIVGNFPQYQKAIVRHLRQLLKLKKSSEALRQDTSSGPGES